MSVSRFFFLTNTLSSIIFFLFIALPRMAHSDALEKPSLTLKDTVTIAMAKNRSLMASGKHVEAMQANADIATGRLLPRISASYSASRSDSPITVFGDKLLQKRFTAADFSIARLNNPSAVNNYRTGLSVALPVYQGGALWAGRRAGEASAVAAEWQYQANRQAVILRVVQTFTLLRQAVAQRKAAAQALEAARNHLADTQALKRRGVAIVSDVMDARAHLLRDEVALQSVTHTVAAARDQLQLLLGVSPKTPFAITGVPDLVLASRDISGWLETADENRPGLREKAHQLEAARARSDAARAPFLPAVNIQATQEWNSNTITPRNGNITIAAEVSVNLFSGGADRARLQAAEAETVSLQLALADLKQRIHNEVLAAWRDLDDSESQLKANEQVLRQTLESLRIRRLRVEQGLERASDVLDAQTRADRARAEAIRSRFALVIAKAQLLYTTGQLTPEVIR